MFANERYDIILDMLKSKRSVTVSELCERFNVSIETVRRDLAHLEKHNKLTRVHGGAIAAHDKSAEIAVLSTRLGENIERKRELSEYAARFVAEGDIIFIDAGSTAIEFASVLCERFSKLTVVTYSPDVINIVSKHEGFELIAIGGTYMPSERMFHGYFAEEMLRLLHTDKSFIFPSSISLKFGATVNLHESLPLECIAMKMSDKTYILGDSTKFETNSPLRICELADADAVITDSGLDDGILRFYRDNGVNLIKG